MFDFEFVYVPGAKHRRPDGLLRRRAIENKGEKEDEGIEEAEDWMNEIIAGGMWVAKHLEKKGEVSVLVTGKKMVDDEDAILEKKEEELEG